jgi:hypothetical protein
MKSRDITKKKKSKKESAGATLARITKQIARSRFDEVAWREEEDANHRFMKHERFMST